MLSNHDERSSESQTSVCPCCGHTCILDAKYWDFSRSCCRNCGPDTGFLPVDLDLNNAHDVYAILENIHLQLKCLSTVDADLVMRQAKLLEWGEEILSTLVSIHTAAAYTVDESR